MYVNAYFDFHQWLAPLEHGTINRVSSAYRVAKVLTKTRKGRPVAENAMKESRPIAWEPRPVRTVSRVSARTFRNLLIVESVEKIFLVKASSNTRAKSW